MTIHCTRPSANTTYVVKPCPRVEAATGERSYAPCRIAEVENFGAPTGVLFCFEHGQMVGEVEKAGWSVLCSAPRRSTQRWTPSLLR